MKRHVRKPPNGRNICPVTKSNMSNRLLSPIDRKFQSPNDNEQNTPMMPHVSVTIVAALPLVIRSSSCRNAVLTSCSDMSDVSAANASSE